MKTTLLWIAGGVGAAALWASTFVVSEGEVAVVTRFGDPSRVEDDAGLHFKWPAPIDAVTLVDQRIHLLDPEPDEFITSDNRNVIIDPFLAWRVEDPRQYLVSLRGREAAEARLEDVLRDSIGTVLGLGPFEDLVSMSERERDLEDVVTDITAEVRRRVEDDRFGVDVELAGIKRINFPESNKASVFTRMRNERETIAAEIRAAGEREATEIRATAGQEYAETIAEAMLEETRIRSEAQSEALRLQLEAWARFPELARFLKSSGLLEKLPAGSELLLPADHPLLDAFELEALVPKDAGGESR